MAYLKVAKSVVLESSHHKKEKFITLYGDMLIRRCRDHFTIYTNSEPLYCTTETTVILYVNYVSIKKFGNIRQSYQCLEFYLKMTNNLKYDVILNDSVREIDK